MSVISEAKQAFEPLLAGYGFRLASELYHHEAFGSASLEYARRGLRFRLIWDGKESMLTAEVVEVEGHGPASAWCDLEALASGQRAPAEEARATGRITQLRDIAADYLASKGPARSGGSDGSAG